MQKFSSHLYLVLHTLTLKLHLRKRRTTGYEESYLQTRLKRTLPVTLLTGSLGSGKTTLLRSLISMRGLDFKLGAIVNDFAEFNFGTDVARISSDKVMELSNGCICCNLANDLRSAVWKILNGEDDEPPDYLLVETSGERSDRYRHDVGRVFRKDDKSGVRICSYCCGCREDFN